MVNKELIAARFKEIQDNICNSLESLDGVGKFQEDLWDRPEGGGGRTRIIKGKHIEKGGVNFSEVYGALPNNIAKSLGFDNVDFYATGVSIVLHPHNAHVPIIHMNIRYFELDDNTWWFGGGIDVTPHYIYENQASNFHHQLKAICDKTDLDFYPKFKEWADNYFYIKHRKETRGVGGIFFDKLDNKYDHSKSDLFNFVTNVGEGFVPIYRPLFKDNYLKEVSALEAKWQRIRRGRYVEFNLVWDRGTKFGLETDGRIESILMSMPPLAKWEYNHKPLEGSPEYNTKNLLRKDIDWLNCIKA